MKLSRLTVGPMVVFFTIVTNCFWLNAQQAPGTAGSTIAADASAKIEELQKELDALKAQIDQLKKAREKNEAPAADPGSAVVTPVPAATARKPGLAETLFDSTTISGSVDGYYGLDFEHPASRQAGLRVFDNYTNQFSLNLAELVVKRSPDKNTRLGYNLTLGFGNAMHVVNALEPGGESFAQNVKEAYLSYLAPIGKGVQIDFGKFVTPAGAEVIESAPGWNYSRGILFGFAIPFYHFGLRAAYSFSPKVALTGYLVNGWNNIVAVNTGKTYGFSLALAPSSKVSITQNYLGGPQTPNTNAHWRHLSDTVVQFNVTPKFSLLENFDYGAGDMIPGVNSVKWTGIATYARYAFNDRNAFAARYEYYDDQNGFTTGTVQHIQEYTLTLERTFAHGLISRLEFRRDMSDVPFFRRSVDLTKNQNTMELGLIYVFDIHGAR
ncbi:MAG TPA: outer membrane beta-barrel protein [Terriglobia bacterium]|nr:outer membrane beta-barrel protein [Terriglobia bacterium]